MSYVNDGQGNGMFVCRRSNRCRGSGQPAVVKPADEDYDRRIECPRCGRVGLDTYETADGRLILLAH